MEIPIAEALEIVGKQTEPHQAWAELVSLCAKNDPSGSWKVLPVPDIERDISAAMVWLSSQLSVFPDAVGIYLGLDTLNMGNGDGTNVEFGGKSECDVSKTEIDWAYKKLNYGESHLIKGLFELHRVYSLPEWKSSFDIADYILFLGYSGIILGQAFVRLQTQRSLLPAWGFHDGDLFVLGRKITGRFEFVCK